MENGRRRQMASDRQAAGGTQNWGPRLRMYGWSFELISPWFKVVVARYQSASLGLQPNVKHGSNYHKPVRHFQGNRLAKRSVCQLPIICL
jgi:hypothetical protein